MDLSDLKQSLQGSDASLPMSKQGAAEHPVFGKFYSGTMFNIDHIKSVMKQSQKDYKEASLEAKTEGIDVELQEGQRVEWKEESIIFPFLPKKYIKSFDRSRCFMSAQVPLLLIANVKNQSELTNEEDENVEKIKVMFKFGDDLRQDNLVLQFFRIMDEMWLEKGMNMEMVTYKVLETGDKIGFIEFVDKSEVITDIHKWRGIFQGPFKHKSIYEFFKQEIYPMHFKTQLNKLKDQKRKLLLKKRDNISTSIAVSVEKEDKELLT